MATDAGWIQIFGAFYWLFLLVFDCILCFSLLYFVIFGIKNCFPEIS